MTSLPLLQGPRDLQCTLCPLHEGSPEPRCIPLTLHPSCHPLGPSSPDPVLVVGMNPGREELRQDRPFCGPSGSLLDNNYLKSSGLAAVRTVWLTNSARCWTPLDSQPKVSHRNTCSRRWIPSDLAFLREHHPSCRVLDVLCLGADASDCILRFVRLVADRTFAKGGSPLRWILQNQGTLSPPLPGDEGWTLRLWATYHPAFLLREGGVQAPAVSAHLSLMVNTIRGTMPDLLAPVVVPPFDPTP